MIDNDNIIEKLLGVSSLDYEEMAHLYEYGEEQLGILKDRKQTKHYYDQAVIEYDADYIEEDNPIEGNFYLHTDAETLKEVEILIKNLTNKYGTSSCERNLNLPISKLMKVLVGTPDYPGNILFMERINPNCLMINAQGNKLYPLAYAFLQKKPQFEYSFG